MADQPALDLEATPPGTYRQRGTSALQRLFRAPFAEFSAARRLWAPLLAKVHEADPLSCPRCSCPMNLLAVITNRQQVRKILRHLIKCGETASGPGPRLRRLNPLPPPTQGSVHPSCAPRPRHSLASPPSRRALSPLPRLGRPRGRPANPMLTSAQGVTGNPVGSCKAQAKGEPNGYAGL